MPRVEKSLWTAERVPGEVELAIWRSGSGSDPVICLHGITAQHRAFNAFARHLGPSRVVVGVDLRGRGDSAKPDSGYGLEAHAGDVIRVLDHLGLQRAVIVGHSMGSIVAMRLALDAPERVEKLVLVAAKPSYGDPALDVYYDEMEALSDPVDPEFVRGFQESTLARPVPDGLIDRVVDESLKLPARVWHGLLGPTLRVDHSADLARIAVPTLLAWGDRDEIATRADQETLLAALPDARLRNYAGGGHAFHWEDPAAFARDLAEFAR